MDTVNPFLLTFILSFAIQALFFAFAATLKTDKVTDLAYGITFIIIAWYWLLRSDVADVFEYVLVAIITLWGIRLAGYLVMRIMKTGVDHRFDDKRDNVWSFAKFWILQGFAIWVIMMPSVYILTREEHGTLSFVAMIGAIIALTGLVIETVADMQLYNFRFNTDNKGKWIESGIWKYSRHPNYFGEMLVWWGLFIYGVEVYEGLGWLTIVGPLFITILLLYISGIPLLEKSSEKRWGDDKDFQRYKQQTSKLIPLPKKK